MNARAIELDFDVMWHIFFWGFLYIYEYRWTGTYYSMLNNIRCRLNKYSQMCTCYRFEKLKFVGYFIVKLNEKIL